MKDRPRYRAPSRTSPRCPWIVWISTSARSALHCRRCGVEQWFDRKLNQIEAMGARASFEQFHQYCSEPRDPRLVA